MSVVLSLQLFCFLILVSYVPVCLSQKPPELQNCTGTGYTLNNYTVPVSIYFSDPSTLACSKQTCESKAATFFNSSLCTNSTNWPNSSTFEFLDTIPSFKGVPYKLLGLSLTLYSPLSCGQGSGVGFFLFRDFINWIILPEPNSTESNPCDCPNCGWSMDIEPIQNIPVYNFSGRNQLGIINMGPPPVPFCLSQLDVVVTYAHEPPCVALVWPLASPTTGGMISVKGKHFYPSPNLRCIINDTIETKAYFINSTMVNCSLPRMNLDDHSLNANVSVRVEFELGTATNDAWFLYYKNPVLKSFYPLQISVGEEKQFTIEGNNFQPNTSVIVGNQSIPLISINCYFRSGDILHVATNSVYINSTLFHCWCPPFKTDLFVNIGISLNSEVYEYFNQTFTVLSKDLTLPFVIWLLVVIIFIFAVGLLALWKAYKRHQEIHRSDNRDLLISSHDSEFDNFIKQIDINEIQIGQRIGKGSFGEAFKGEWKGTTVAIKKLPAHSLNEEFLHEFAKEAMIMRNLRHPNILQFMGACTDPPDICIVMEFMSRGSLYRIIHEKSIALSWSVIKKMAIDAAKGMAYLHDSDPAIIHRDLKSHNLLVDENWKVKVCDFGLSRIYGDAHSMTMTACGTPCWTAPEILRNTRYTEKADIFSFAIVLWEMASREDPFAGMPPFQVIFAVGTQGARPPMPAFCPPDYSLLMESCWQEDPERRPTFNEILIKLDKFQV